MKLEEKTDEVPDKTKYSMHGVQHEELAQILKKIGNKEETQQVRTSTPAFKLFFLKSNS